MTRDQLLEFIHDDLQKVLKIFEAKNQAYGNDRDGFYNFRETARRLVGQAPAAEQIFGVLLTLADKHWVALMQGGAKTDEAADRLLDIVVYSLIGRAMLDESIEAKLYTSCGEVVMREVTAEGPTRFQTLGESICNVAQAASKAGYSLPEGESQ